VELLETDPRFARNYVEGEWRFSKQGYELDVQDPREGIKVVEVCRSGRHDVDDAIPAVRAAAEGWRGTPLEARVELLRGGLERLQDQSPTLAAVLEVDLGLPTDVARTQVATLLERARGLAPPSDASVATPLGRRDLRPPEVIAHLPAFTEAPSAFLTVLSDLFEGRAVVLHPSEHAPLAAVCFVAAFEALPPGVLTLLQGTNRDVGARLPAVEGIDAVRAGGSPTRLGAVMRAASTTVKRVEARPWRPSELVCFEGAKPDEVASWVTERLRHRAAGPLSLGVRVQVQDVARDAVVAALREAVDGLRPASLQPLATEEQQRAVAGHFAELADARLAGGGPTGQTRGYWCSPLLVEAGAARAFRLPFPAPLAAVEVFEAAPRPGRSTPAVATAGGLAPPSA
jgi:acyl-CoA reductase-like NAD-dependent aldehyde dehydrogenase